MGSSFTITLQLDGLPADAILEVRLPAEALSVALEDLLEWVLPMDEEGQALVQDSFNLEENPDLPEIYESFLVVMEQTRSGLCQVQLTEKSRGEARVELTEGTCLEEDDLPRGCNSSLLLTPVYDALGYAEEQGYDAGEPDLLEWLQLCAAFYFLDRHEVPLPNPNSPCAGTELKQVIENILNLELVGQTKGGEANVITAEGRSFIGRLLAETESYIDRYDIFSDVLWDGDTGEALFGTGHGNDLRVETFIAEAVDPVRAVFLLRLYDGSLDEFVGDWENLVISREFYNRLLEPVVDRSVTPSELLEEIVDQGLSLLEDARQLEEQKRSNALIARRVGDIRDSFPQ
ncbi:MAG: hypothetical protein OXR67_11855 [Chloroflexota bacterium]|nr:hypothetical protein [Chloroflexota bacterium]